MNDVYYTYDGILEKCEIKEIIIQMLELSTNKKSPIKIREDIQRLLSDEEKIVVRTKTSVKESICNSLVSYPGLVVTPQILLLKIIHPFIIPILDIHVNLKIATISILALLLDAALPLGVASQVLALSGVNNKAFAKLDEVEGDKCILFEVCVMSEKKAKLETLAKKYSKECINNHLKCKYRENAMCKITLYQIKGICDKLVSKNVFKSQNGFYFYNI